MGKWNLAHDPLVQPLDCRGRPGEGGAQWHRRTLKEPACKVCLKAARWMQAERARGQKYPKRLKPCGTYAAAMRHRRRREPLDFACAVAEADYNTALRRAARASAASQGRGRVQVPAGP